MNCCSSSSGNSIPAVASIARISFVLDGGKWLRSFRRLSLIAGILGHFDLQAPNREEIVRNWRQRPGMLGFRFTFNQPHQQNWWTDGSLDWFWAACEREKLPVGLLAGGHMAPFGKIAQRHPELKLHIDHLGRRGGGGGEKDAAAIADLPDMLALAKLPNVGVKM